MTLRRLTIGAGLIPERNSRNRNRFTIANNSREEADTRLKEALDREAALVEALARDQALLRQMNEVIRKLSAWHDNAAGRLASLTPREREVMDMVLAGNPSKNIAADLGISQRTVENHRAAIMKRTGTKCIPSLARLAFAAAWTDLTELSP